MKRKLVKRVLSFMICAFLAAESLSGSLVLDVFAEDAQEINASEFEEDLAEETEEESRETENPQPQSIEEGQETEVQTPEEESAEAKIVETKDAETKDAETEAVEAKAANEVDLDEAYNAGHIQIRFLDKNYGENQYYYNKKEINPNVAVLYWAKKTKSGSDTLSLEECKSQNLSEEEYRELMAQLNKQAEEKTGLVDPDYRWFLLTSADVKADVNKGVKLGKYDVKVTGIEDLETKKLSNDFSDTIFKGSITANYEIVEDLRNGHGYGGWTTIRKSTALTQGQQKRVCSICGNVETRLVNKLTPTVKLNMTTIKLKKKQSTSAFSVSGLADGDYVKSYRSSNKRIFTVNSKGKITAKKKKGSAKLYVTLASGKVARATVKVQSSTVKTTSVSVNTSSVTLLKGGKYTLKTSRKPLTSGQKIRYSSSNKKIATVNSKGTITAKKKGKCKIYVKSGSKKKTITVNVIALNYKLGDTTGFLRSCKKITDIIIKDGNWIYSSSKLKKNFADARNASVRKTSCANYVCMCLQEFGIFDQNMTFYSDAYGNIKYEGSSTQKKETQARMSQAFDTIDLGTGIVAKKANLQPGDICCYNGHTNIFAFYDQKGNPWWYDGGRNSTTDGKPESGVFVNMYRSCSYSTKPVKKILRMKKTLN